ncbi:MAG: c-type cytochrome biogenesis protein CcmI [Betaproteobacteria bacterium]|nr:c-type cytochrome biogenesis protein CcmI [Betaproteobacteria bacterium]
MTSFILAASALTLLAIAFVLVPVWRSIRRANRHDEDTALAVETSNLAVARAQRDEILRDHAAGLMSDAEKEEALDQIARRLAQDLGDASGAAEMPAAQTAMTGGVKAVVAILVIVIPVVAGLMYWQLGSPEGLNPPSPHQTAEPALGDQQIIAMVDALTEKMKTRADDAQGWSLLARSQAAIGRFEGAARSYERLNQLKPNDADILADYAEVVAMTQQESFEGKPWQLVQQALAINPDQRKALAIAGTTELRRRNLPQALGHWERLLRLLPPDSEDARQVSSAILEVRLAMTGNAGTVAAKPADPQGSDARAAKPPAAQTAQQSAPPAAKAAGGAEKVAGTVTLSPEMAKLAAPGDTLFIFARAAGPNAPRMPLAIIRASVSELPKIFELTDGMAMAPNVKLSDFPQVTIEARVSKAGNAVSQPGDLIGASPPVKPGTSGVKVVIDRVVK